MIPKQFKKNVNRKFIRLEAAIVPILTITVFGRDLIGCKLSEQFFL